jgi:hypothetical protein
MSTNAIDTEKTPDTCASQAKTGESQAIAKRAK